MSENLKSTFICFNEGVKDSNGGTACIIVRIEDMNLSDEKITGTREILGEAVQRLRDLLEL